MDTKVQQISTWLGSGSINLFGAPFSGKDTQGRALTKLFGAPLIGGGDILRSHRDPQKIKEIMASGGLIPSDFYFDLVLPYLSKPEFANKPLLLDALGRAHGEEPTIVRATQQSGHALKAAIVLTLPESEVWRRFEAAKKLDDRPARSDDRREVLQNRLQTFARRTLPVIDYYRHMGLLIEVDGAQSREQVTHDIVEKLSHFAARH